MTDATPILYVLIIFLALVVIFLIARLAFVQDYVKKLRRTLRRLEGAREEEPEDEVQDELGG